MKLLLYFSFSFIMFSMANINRTAGSGNNSTKIEIETASCTYQINHRCDSPDKIKYILFTGKSIANAVTLDVSNVTKKTPPSYDGSLPLKVIIHGYGGSRFVHNIIKAYLSKGGNNVLLVDWGPLARKPCYFSANVNTWQVGKCASLALHQLFPAKYVHIVGFSLGAHVAGILSNYLNEQFGKKADRITGLDPALPLYVTPLEGLKLDASDADFVDVIHTSVGTYGKVEPSGHQDFYVNEYPTQPGCDNVTTSVACSHSRSTELFAESIVTNIGFWATPCYSIWYYIIGLCPKNKPNEQQILMGEYSVSRYTGIYYVKTAKSPPYALGKVRRRKQS